MADYSIPPINNLPFNFDSGGYQVPDFNNMHFRDSLRPTYSSTSELQSAISVMQLYQDTTYTYTKACRTIVTGYSTNGIQTLRLPCEYAGIRDIGTYIYGNPLSVDLGSSIFIFSGFDLLSYINIVTEDSIDLPKFIHAWQQGQKNLVTAIRVFDKDTIDFSSRLKIFLGVEIEQDLSTYLYSIPPKDISSILNIIDIKNLPNSIEGVWLKGNINLSSQVPSISARSYNEITSSLHSWQLAYLAGEIHPNTSVDLYSHMVAGTFGIAVDLGSYMFPVVPIQLGSNIYGLATKDLNSTLISGYDSGFIHKYINAIPYVELKTRLNGYKDQKVERDLNAYVEGFYLHDLGGIINIITPSDLGAYINSAGKSINLAAEIIPMIIRMSTVFKVSLLEHKNLPSLINYGCRLSAYKELPSYVYPYMKRDLKNIIIGWHFDFADNVRDLKAYINAGEALVEDKLDVSYFNDPPAYTKLDVNYTLGTDAYKVIDSLVVAFSNKDYATLTSYVYGYPHSADLPTYINAQIQSNFTTTPEWVNPKTTEVFINLRRFEDRWTRFVDLMFTTGLKGENYYFYVSGAERVYKVNKDQQWVLWVTGYNKTTEVMAERTDIRRKFIFNLRDYATMDHAIRDMMDRVVEYRKVDLNSVITSYLPIHANLNSSLNVLFKYRWTKNVKSTIKSIQSGYYNILMVISPELYKDQIELSSLIEGKSYEPPSGDGIEFIFEDADYTAPVTYNNMDWTFEQV